MWNQGEFDVCEVVTMAVLLFCVVAASVSLNVHRFVLIPGVNFVWGRTSRLISCHGFTALSGSYSESSMGGGYTQSPGGFASPTLSQGGEKKGVCISVCSTGDLKQMYNSDVQNSILATLGCVVLN